MSNAEPNKGVKDGDYLGTHRYAMVSDGRWYLDGLSEMSAAEVEDFGPFRRVAYVDEAAAPMTHDARWVAEQRSAGWPDMHPEDFCHKCGTRNMSWATATRDDWLTATSAWAAETGREGICCPQCFADMYDDQTGQKACWILTRDGASATTNDPFDDFTAHHRLPRGHGMKSASCASAHHRCDGRVYLGSRTGACACECHEATK